MSRTRQMLELSVPAVLRETRPERFTVAGFKCPDCQGQGWGWRQDYSHPDADLRGGWMRVTCTTCDGTGALDAEVTVRWRKQKGDAS